METVFANVVSEIIAAFLLGGAAVYVIRRTIKKNTHKKNVIHVKRAGNIRQDVSVHSGTMTGQDGQDDIENGNGSGRGGEGQEAENNLFKMNINKNNIIRADIVTGDIEQDVRK